MPRPEIQPEDCSHSNARKEVISGQRTGEWVCDACGGYWTSSDSLEAAQQRYEARKQERESKIQNTLMKFQQLSTASKEDAADAIGQMAHDKVADLVNGDSLSYLIGETNACGWGIDTLEVDPDSIEVTPDEITCSADVQFTGDQDLDSPACGDTISGTVIIRIDSKLFVTIEDDGFELEDY